ncbi:MAG: winged helix DNA-binding domain-containing protein [Bacteroidetes bacterium]|nr:winged helix DNA-binding domain-containing protein [Bacteroidota bacterium]
MNTIEISTKQARQFLAFYHGLSGNRKFSGKAGIVNIIKQLGAIQFDPLQITGTNPELVLQSRIADFRPEMLQELLYSERVLFDGWDKMMSISCMDDWLHFSRMRQSVLSPPISKHTTSVLEILPKILHEIEKLGPVSSLELSDYGTIDWHWAPAKQSRAALDVLFASGQIGIHHRVHTRKYYDLSERLLPRHILEKEDTFVSTDDYNDWRFLRRVGGFGIVWNKPGDAWLGLPGSRERNHAIARLLKNNSVQEISVSGSLVPFLIRTQDLPILNESLETPETIQPELFFIAPLDNLIWDRQMIEFLFGFSYRWEVYKPAVERKFGYYVLPIFFNNMFAARFEPVKDKKNNMLTIKNWWWEPSFVENTKEKGLLLEALPGTMNKFCNFLGVSETCCLPAVPKEIQESVLSSQNTLH